VENAGKIEYSSIILRYSGSSYLPTFLIFVIKEERLLPTHKKRKEKDRKHIPQKYLASEYGTLLHDGNTQYVQPHVNETAWQRRDLKEGAPNLVSILAV